MDVVDEVVTIVDTVTKLFEASKLKKSRREKLHKLKRTLVVL